MKMLKCVKCGYEWLPRKPEDVIKECPQCKNRNWRMTNELEKPEIK